MKLFIYIIVSFFIVSCVVQEREYISSYLYSKIIIEWQDGKKEIIKGNFTDYKNRILIKNGHYFYGDTVFSDTTINLYHHNFYKIELIALDTISTPKIYIIPDFKKVPKNTIYIKSQMKKYRFEK